MKVRYGLLRSCLVALERSDVETTLVVKHAQLKSTWLIAFIGWTAALCNAASVIPPGEQIASVIPAGEQITLRSEILDEDRAVFVALPASYRRGAERYPVLYLTDAQWNFEQARATTQYLSRNLIIPEMIVVGVVNRDRTESTPPVREVHTTTTQDAVRHLGR